MFYYQHYKLCILGRSISKSIIKTLTRLNKFSPKDALMYHMFHNQIYNTNILLCYGTVPSILSCKTRTPLKFSVSNGGLNHFFFQVNNIVGILYPLSH